MMNKYLVTVSILLGLLTAGCAQSHQMALTDDFGDSVKTNKALQVINPEAGSEDMPPMELDGQKAEAVLKAYREEKGEAGTEDLVKDISDQNN